MKEKIYYVKYSESKGKILLTIEKNKLIFKKRKGIFNKKLEEIDNISFNNIKTKAYEPNIDINNDEVIIELKDKDIKIIFENDTETKLFIKELNDKVRNYKKEKTNKKLNNIKNYINIGTGVAVELIKLYNDYKSSK